MKAKVVIEMSDGLVTYEGEWGQFTVGASGLYDTCIKIVLHSPNPSSVIVDRTSK